MAVQILATIVAGYWIVDLLVIIIMSTNSITREAFAVAVCVVAVATLPLLLLLSDWLSIAILFEAAQPAAAA